MGYSRGEMAGATAWFQAVASQTLEDEIIETDDTVFTQRRTPLGVGAAIVSCRFVRYLLSFQTMRLAPDPMELSPKPPFVEGEPTCPRLCLQNDGWFNFCTQVAPALLAGNTLIVKPSPMTPLATLKFIELAQQILPPGVLSVLSGDDDLYVFLSQ